MAADKTGQKQARSADVDSKAVTTPYEPSQAERVALEAVRDRRRARSSAPRFKVEKKGIGRIPFVIGILWLECRILEGLERDLPDRLDLFPFPLMTLDQGDARPQGLPLAIRPPGCRERQIRVTTSPGLARSWKMSSR
jgi:hypothetical protein